VDAVLWLLGALLAAVAVVDAWRSGRPLVGMLQGTWAYSSGLLFVFAGVALVVIASRRRASREEADLLRRYPRGR
jgi:hypothetical protein